jgi:predicted Zn finger-like uncharacterized protein
VNHKQHLTFHGFRSVNGRLLGFRPSPDCGESPVEGTMLIHCPNCATSYKVDTSSIGDRGRTVRCHRCDHVWLATASADEPTLPEQASEETIKEFATELGAESIAPMPAIDDAPPTAPEAATPSITDLMKLAAGATEPGQSEPLALSDITIPVAEAPLPPIDPPAPTEPAIENQIPDGASAARHRRTRLDTQRRARPKAHLTLVALALVLVTASLLNWRKDVVRHLPQLASFYTSIGLPVNLRGLTLANVTIGRETSDGVPVLVIDGTIVNSVSTPVEIPQLRFAVQNAAGAEIYSWMATPTQRTLEPGATLPFRTRLASPPDNGHNVQVRFFTRRDVVAGLF